MPHTFIDTADGRRVAVPRAAEWIGRAVANAWLALERLGERRGRRAMLEAADRIEPNAPELAAEIRRNIRAHTSA